MQAQRKLVSFIGLGSQTATALLYTYIREHPAACVPEEQINFFSDATQYAKGVAWYEGLYVVKKKQRVCGELASNYLHSGQAAKLIARTYPNAKLLAVIDDPLLCVRMEYVQARQDGVLSKNITFEQFIKQTPEVLLRSKFGRLLVSYFSYYSTRDLLVLLASKVETDPLSVLKDTYEHCGLEASFVPLSLRYLVIEEEDDTKKRPGIIKRIYKQIKRLIKFIYTKITQVIFPPNVLKETILERAKRIELSPEMEKYLKDYYREDVQILSSLLHRDFNAEWSI